MSIFTNPIATVVSAVSSAYKKREDRKINKQSGDAKLSQMKQGDATSVTLTDAEGEAVMAANADGTWKDEYVTIVITAPIAIIIAGAVYFAFSGDDRLINAGIDSIKALTEAGIDMGFLMQAVVLSAIGLKVWRGM